MADLFASNFPERLRNTITETNRTLKLLHATQLDPAPILQEFHIRFTPDSLRGKYQP